MRVVSGSGGSFLNPPGHPSHEWHLESGPTHNPDLIAGLEYALANEYGDVPESIRARVQRMFDGATLVESELYVAHVYSYFRNCYAPESGSRKVSDCIVWREPKPTRLCQAGADCEFFDPEREHVRSDDCPLPVTPAKPPAERSLAVLMIRQHFPEHPVREDLLDQPGGYGQKPCTKCGIRLQYEPRVDALAEPGTAKRACPKGGLHDPNPSTTDTESETAR